MFIVPCQLLSAPIPVPADWWEADGRLTHAQRLDLDAASNDAMLWCELASLWLDEETASLHGCSENLSESSWRGGVNARTDVDSNGSLMHPKLNTHLTAGAFSGRLGAVGDGAASTLRPRTALLAVQNRFAKALAGDFNASEADFDPWAGSQRGLYAEMRPKPWRVALLATESHTAGLHLVRRDPSQDSHAGLWLLAAQESPLFWIHAQTPSLRFRSRISATHGGSWSDLRYKLISSPSSLRLGGDLRLRTGDKPLPLLVFPKAFAEVRLWSAQWQEIFMGTWKIRFAQTTVVRSTCDSLAASLTGERRRQGGRLVAEATCRAAQEGCGLPRVGLGAGWKTHVNSPDSLLAEARLQSPRWRGMAHVPRLRVGWERALGARVHIGQSVALPEGYRRSRSITLRQETRLRLPDQIGTQTRLALRMAFRTASAQPVELESFNLTLDISW